MKNFKSILICGFILTGSTAIAQNDTYSYSAEIAPTASPYVVTLTIPPSVTMSALSDGGFRTNPTQLSWGPFEGTEIRTLQFSAIGPGANSLSNVVTVTYYGSGSEAQSTGEPVAVPESYDSWLFSALGGVVQKRLSQSISMDLDKDQTPNVVEYLLGMNPITADSIWDHIELLDSGSNKQLKFPYLYVGPDYKLFVESLDLSGDGLPGERLEPVLTGGDYSLNNLGDTFIFRLIAQPQ
jgi:hypothetical protein